MLAEFETKPIEMNTLTMRPATLDDIPGVVEAGNACAIAQIGRPDMEADDLHNEWTSPKVNLAENMRVVETDDGRIVGVIEVWDTDPLPVSNWVWARVHPDFENMGIGSMLMDWADQRLQVTAERVPEDLRVYYHCDSVSTYLPSIQLFEDRKLKLVRHFWHMEIELDKPIPQPVWPQGIRLTTFAEIKDMRQVYLAFDDAFKDHWGHVDQPADGVDGRVEEWQHWVQNDKHFDPNLWFLAVAGEEIAAVCLANPNRQEDPDMGWVDILGVRRPWRKQGLGLALLHHTFAALQTFGKLRCGLGVDAASLTGATRLYEKAGMHIARQYDAYEKEIRSGRDISRR
ncbi:MAG: GNAT family N-acetyltransferase [Anaerolineales bacterium]|nr:GNAT family N-acetyltransferase [Anaerolineales bacterium]